MTSLVLPERVRVRVLTWEGPIQAPRERPVSRPIALEVHAFARAKNDFFLGPFFSDAGVVTITKEALERSAAIHLDFGLMDYHALSECYSMVEIRALSAADVDRAIQARKAELKQGSFFSKHETEWWGSPKDLVGRLKESGNRDLKDPGPIRVRDEWNGSKLDVEYEYRVPPVAA
jgi:hypothetical protein